MKYEIDAEAAMVYFALGYDNGTCLSLEILEDDDAYFLTEDEDLSPCGVSLNLSQEERKRIASEVREQTRQYYNNPCLFNQE